MNFRIVCLIVVSLAGAPTFAENADQPLPPAQAAATMLVPNGFEVTLFAGEPDVMQPIGFCTDDRGRLWVAEAYSYPKHSSGNSDRIVILEDTDGDGTHDKRTVFYDKLNYVSGIEVGFGGAWVMSPPYFYFIPDANGDDQPDSEPKVLLDGFGNHANAHNMANGFAWGPDGWLYGTHGRTNWSMIGKPGADEKKRVRFDGGVYRYHPTRHVWEPYADGTTNPWGIDWNDRGHAFISNCVNPHLFQVIQGAHYEPWRGRKSSEFAYQRIETIADHLHFVGLSNVRTGLGSEQEDEAGGGHAHCGAMIYQGGMFPERYRNTLMTCNIHGRRINNDLPRRKGSGYVASHGPDFMRSKDPWFMGVTLAYGPSGEVYVSDWSDTGECHSTRNTRKHTGRIYRITYDQHQLPPVDLKQKTDKQLVELQTSDNAWMSRHAKRLLQERASAGKSTELSVGLLEELFYKTESLPIKLRCLWALHSINAPTDTLLIDCLSDSSEDLRSWAITLLCEGGLPAENVQKKLMDLAANDPSQLVRLSIASALQRFPLGDRYPFALELAAHAEDASDQNLPLMIWYAYEPLIEWDMDAYAQMLQRTQIGQIRTNVARRLASYSDSELGLNLVAQYLSSAKGTAARELLEGMLQGTEGRRSLSVPDQWSEIFARLSDDPKTRESIVLMAVRFRDPVAIQQVKEVALSPTENKDFRCLAIKALADQRVAEFEGSLLKLVGDPRVARAAIAALANYNASEAGSKILSAYPSLDARSKQTAMATLTSRKAWAASLLDAIETNQVSASDINAFAARQIRSLGDQALSKKLAGLWGDVRESPKARRKQIDGYKKWLKPELVSSADLADGRAIFQKQCAACHNFVDLVPLNGSIGPDITGAQRNNLDYLLENIVDPSASVAEAYRMQIFQTEDGRLITGIVETENDTTIAIRTADRRIVLEQSEIEARRVSPESIMPAGLLDSLSETQIRNLFGFLQSDLQ